MNNAIIFFASEKDPNGLEQTRANVFRILEATSENITVIVVSEGEANLLTDFPAPYLSRTDTVNNSPYNSLLGKSIR